jgi:hypothetical protein
MNTPQFDRHTGLKRLGALKEAGAKWDRCDLWWGRIEPEQGQFVWDDVDWVMKQYKDAGIELMPILCYGSAWQKSDAPVTDEERRLYARFVHRTISRYKAQVRVWEIWNEPNITPFWSPRPDVKEYAKLLKLAYAAAKQADPECTIVGAVTAGADLRFIEDLFREGGGEWMDAISIHPYQGDLGSLSPERGGLEEQIRTLHKLLAQYDCRKPIHITEIGHRTPGTAGHTHVTEAQQAAYLVRTFVIAQASGAQRVFWFNLQDWEEFWGIIRQDFTRKPSFAAYQAMTQELEGKRPVGRLELGDKVAAYAFASGDGRASVLVAWRTDDTDGIIRLGDREIRVGMMPVFVNDLDPPVLESLKPLP